MMLTERKYWIDELRGIAILMVIYGHIASGLYGYFLFTSPVKVPMFFIISGFLTQIDNQKETSLYFKSLLKRIIIPWIIMGFVPHLIIALLEKRTFDTFLNTLLMFLWGDILWFMPCTVVSQVIWYFLIKATKKQKMKIDIFTIVISFFTLAYISISMIGSSYNLLLNSGISVGLVGIGVIFQRIDFNKKNYSTILILALLYIGICFFYYIIFPGETLDFHTNRFLDPLITLIAIITGSMCLFAIFSKLKSHRKILTFIGQNTLAYYMLHEFVYHFILRFNNKYLRMDQSSILFILVCFVVVVLLCGMLVLFINRFCPVINGRGRE